MRKLSNIHDVEDYIEIQENVLTKSIIRAVPQKGVPHQFSSSREILKNAGLKKKLKIPKMF